MDNPELLIIEDDTDDAELILLALRRNAVHCKVTVLRNGEAALDYLFGEGEYVHRNTSVQPKIILLDLKLPGISGVEVLKRLRENKITRRIPIVVLTSSVEKQDLLDCHNLGVNSYIQKEVNTEDFTETIRQLGTYWTSLNVAPPQEI